MQPHEARPGDTLPPVIAERKAVMRRQMQTVLGGLHETNERLARLLVYEVGEGEQRVAIFQTPNEQGEFLVVTVDGFKLITRNDEFRGGAEGGLRQLQNTIASGRLDGGGYTVAGRGYDESLMLRAGGISEVVVAGYKGQNRPHAFGVLVDLEDSSVMEQMVQTNLQRAEEGFARQERERQKIDTQLTMSSSLGDILKNRPSQNLQS